MLSLWSNAREGVQRVFVQVRHAHKKVVSSKTHMQDSPGKRLGPKKYENHQVSIGQIIYRQRGTKWYPGFGCGIGKDHTIFAMEPGFVKYYLDPFHPKRKFIGVAKSKDDVLPYNHFEPNVRRLGRQVLKGKWAHLEANSLPRKVELGKERVFEDLNKRQEKRLAKQERFLSELNQFIQLENASDLELAAIRLVAIDGHLRGGKSIEDARFYTTYNYKYDLKLSQIRGEISADQLKDQVEAYVSLAQKVDSAVMFDSHFNLTQNLTNEEIESLKASTLTEIQSLVPDLTTPVSKKTKEAVLALIAKPFWTLKDQLNLKRRFLKPVLPQSDSTLAKEGDKKSTAIHRMNLDTRNVETIYRSKQAFLP